TRIPIHPGVTLKQDFLEPLELSANRLAAAIKVPQNRISAIVNASRGISADPSRGDTHLRPCRHRGRKESDSPHR
ncbi:MAG TPA: HigA family addiction module antitoxin, partial [Alphaproteobacteria bacterium]|nr:HigA family addiction module antitoxin [Alphaproteobacteria bacterium]